jgi:hypothetical protein
LPEIRSIYPGTFFLSLINQPIRSTPHIHLTHTDILNSKTTFAFLDMFSQIRVHAWPDFICTISHLTLHSIGKRERGK